MTYELLRNYLEVNDAETFTSIPFSIVQITCYTELTDVKKYVRYICFGIWGVGIASIRICMK